MTVHVLVTCPHLQRTIDHYRPLFQKLNIEITTPSFHQKMKEEELIKIIERFDGVIAGDDEFTANVLKHGKKLKIIAKWGVGVDGIDLKAAEKLGIKVMNTPAVFSNEVADMVIGYLILLSRKLHLIDRNVRSGQWDETQIQGISLEGKTLGIIGVGNIGREVAVRARAMKMHVLGYDLYPPPEEFIRNTQIRMVEVSELISASHFITLNCNLTEQNRHILNPDSFSRMKKGVFIVNTSRGQLIDEAALAEGFRTGIVAGAALDVFEEEPLPGNSPLRQFENCILGAHNSSNTFDAVMRTNELAINNLLNGLGVKRE
ncbi:phosphoglycerate dehydrogenase [uncultured Methanoregula sp.]|uniref:phosphoglycerate dehydrogenase n=1 Tax=uncultured Methanoregula sp. TaxID=1005933 RepID=UPI002AAB800E|nr:phosphoglycerate dehydrogenase [uncultured Methanoregula sp.]